MSDFSPGQRWLSETETELGLGIIQHVDHRLVTVFFPACEEERTYSKQNLPLSRVSFNIGDTIETTQNKKMRVADIEEVNGLLVYLAHPLEQADQLMPVPEVQLNHHLDLNAATDRLFARQLDHNRWFKLRYAALQARSQAENTDIKGLRGPRIDLVPHQLYIAHEVGLRFAPRVLLADEVGLGKTIEAGLIIHQQLITHRAQRVLIVVPSALIHQWFVEMVRRFNLHFSIFDESRLSSLQADQSDIQALFADEDETLELQEEQDAPTNPFLSEQLVLCSTEFLSHCEETGCFPDLLDAEWDLLVVDEAHHLEWHPEQPGDDYLRIEQLSRQTRGLLLLTATPEQLGRESHFARLRLLDPDRYGCLDSFIQEQNEYQEVARLASHLHDDEHWSNDIREQTKKRLPDMTIQEADRENILKELLDRYGTGRVLFRNTRKHIPGFPERKLNPVPLPLPDMYADQHHEPLEIRLHPEQQFQDDSWCNRDPRVKWLESFFREYRSEKVLVICAHRETAIDLHAFCNYKLGMNAGLFHEQLDLIERDRSAAWFADSQDGAQALFCSEIGSEGRNFQFAHHLVLFDLPHNPDLLEQRIGRLDRIGQTATIQIHVPYFCQHPQESLFNWYHQGMDAFEHTNPAGTTILKRTRELLLEALQVPEDEKVQQLLLEQTQSITGEIREALESGRDRLLELGSLDQDVAGRLIDELEDADQHTPSSFMEQVFERFGVDSEYHSEHAQILRPTEQMIMPFPHLPDEGITLTDHRPTALSRDDMQFMTWEHPMVVDAIEMILSDAMGKACVAMLKNPKIKPGTLLVEVIYRLESVAPKALQAQRYLPITSFRYLLEASGKDLGHAISHDALNKQCRKMEKTLARKIVSSQKELLEKLLQENQQKADQDAASHTEKAMQEMQQQQQHELNRLLQLRQKNPLIRDEEIHFIEQQTEQLAEHLAESRCHMEAIRVIVSN